MAPLKVKSQAKPIEARGPTKIVTASKFKIYSENDKRDTAVGTARSGDSLASTTSSRVSLLSKKGTVVTSKFGLKDLGSGVGVTTGNKGNLDKAKVGRKALADVSNLRGVTSRFEKPGGSRISITSGAVRSTASSKQPAVVKGKVNISHGVTASSIDVKAGSKTTRSTSNIFRLQTVEVKNRKSFPVLKRTQLGASSGPGNVTNGEAASRKHGFPLKPRLASHVPSQMRNSQGLKCRASDGFIQMASRNQTRKEAPQRTRKSIKPLGRTTTQPVVVQSCKPKGSADVGAPLGTTSTQSEKEDASKLKSLKCMEPSEAISEEKNILPGSDSMKAQISDPIKLKRPNRRKSYTSSLISRSKLEGDTNKVTELDNLPNIDDQGNPLEVSEYVDDIYQYYWTIEAQNTSLVNYMMIQKEITPQMRSILINWLIEVHLKFDLMPETLYLTVALLDRYLSLVPIKKKEMQLVGLTSLLLASKYEDFWHPRVKELIGISAESYTRKQMLEMEKDMLKKLKFRFNLPTPYVFMLRFLKASQSDKQLEYLGFYLIELCQVDYEALKFRPSLLCASAVYVARCTLNKVPVWTPLLAKHTQYEESHIRDCAEMILRLHKTASTGVLKVTYDKYRKTSFGGVAAIKPLSSLSF